MHRPRRSGLVLLPLLLAAHAARAGAASGSGPAAGPTCIVQGQPWPGDGAVVSLLDGQGRLRCSGVLIEPDVVLTAGHCADDALVPAACAWTGGVAGTGGWAGVLASALHPDYLGPSGPAGADLGLLLLERAPGPAPLPLRATDLDASATGAEVTIAGFGRTASALPDEGLRRVGRSRITAVAPGTLAVEPAPGQPCVLDSGGPACLGGCASGEVVALVSRGDASCTGGATLVRADAARAFIRARIAAWRSAPRPAARTCPHPEAGAGGCGHGGGGALALLLAGALLGAARRRARPARPALQRTVALAVRGSPDGLADPGCGRGRWV